MSSEQHYLFLGPADRGGDVVNTLRQAGFERFMIGVPPTSNHVEVHTDGPPVTHERYEELRLLAQANGFYFAGLKPTEPATRYFFMAPVNTDPGPLISAVLAGHPALTLGDSGPFSDGTAYGVSFLGPYGVSWNELRDLAPRYGFTYDGHESDAPHELMPRLIEAADFLDWEKEL